ncbi:RagB/SusD family nutrient uptake outer membrane protein [Petrimonas sp.]|uniref:RagB/SusD family nutrient uptake outer membrane protein n=1 Tax=Petrimonas sp. TaxID=2023866 RepID=UPI003F5101B8
MKKYLYSSIFLLLTVGFASCEDYLDTPVPSIDQYTYFSNDQTALDALVGVYDPMGWMEYIQYLDWAIGDVVSDDADKGGGGDSDQPQMLDMEKFRATPETPTFSIVWKQLYIGINRANRVIEGVTDNNNVSAEGQKRITAEAKFLRAYYNFCLIKVFGAFPIVDHILAPSEFAQPRNTLEECWAAIEKDLKDAMAFLPHKKDMPASELGRATWGAAAGFLTKAYIFQEKWQDAEPLAKQIVASGDYDLEKNYGDLFTIATDNGIESVFDVQKKDFKMTQWGDENEGSMIEIYQRSRDARNGGWGFNQPTQNLYDEFETGDIRREWTIIKDGDVLWEGTPDEEVIYTNYDPVHNPDAPKVGYCKRKGTIPMSQRPDMVDAAGLNVRVIRFADVLLWQAEAAVHNNSDWKTPLNRVRARVGLGNSPYASDPLKAVYHERRVELALESHRYWDLVRTGRGNLMPGYTESKRYFPIPQIEINLNPNLTQNPY